MVVQTLPVSIDSRVLVCATWSLPMQSMAPEASACHSASCVARSRSGTLIFHASFVQHEIVRADLAIDRQPFGLGSFDFGNGFPGRHMNDIDRTARDLGHSKGRFLACPASVNAGERSSQAPMSVRTRRHQTFLQDAGNLPILAVEQRDRRRAELGDGIERRVKCCRRQTSTPARKISRPLHLQVQLKGSDTVFLGQVWNLAHVLVGAEDRRQKKSIAAARDAS